MQPWYPKTCVAGRGCRLTAEGKTYVDLNAALGSITIGYGQPEIVGDLPMGMNWGPTLSLPTLLEGEAAAVFVERIVGSRRSSKGGVESVSLTPYGHSGSCCEEEC